MQESQDEGMMLRFVGLEVEINLISGHSARFPASAFSMTGATFVKK